MLLGMALFKLDILSAGRSVGFYFRLMCGGSLVGLTVNTYEVFNTINSQFDLLVTFSYTKPTYQVGRLGMAMGYDRNIARKCTWRLLWTCRKPHPDTLERFAAAMGVDVAEFPRPNKDRAFLERVAALGREC